MSHSRWQAEMLLRAFWANQPLPSSVATHYIALLDASFTEVTAAGYARMPIAVVDWSEPISDATTTRIENTVPIMTPFAEETWPTTPYFRVWTSLVAGNPLTGNEPLSDPTLTINIFERAVFATSDISIVWPSTL